MTLTRLCEANRRSAVRNDEMTKWSHLEGKKKEELNSLMNSNFESLMKFFCIAKLSDERWRRNLKACEIIGRVTMEIVCYNTSIPAHVAISFLVLLFLVNLPFHCSHMVALKSLPPRKLSHHQHHISLIIRLVANYAAIPSQTNNSKTYEVTRNFPSRN